MSETTHLICAHCGCDNAVSNFARDSNTLVMQLLNGAPTLMFHCGGCQVQYHLPFTLVDLTTAPTSAVKAELLRRADLYQHEDGSPGPLADQWGWQVLAKTLREIAAKF